MNHSEILNELITLGNLAGVSISNEEIEIELLQAPHTPPTNLPEGKMGIYIFSTDQKCLKIGKVGPKSKARYTSQHYNHKSSSSNLAKSILQNREDFASGITEENVGAWIKENTNRINILLESRHDIELLSLFETFLHCKYKPKFEGFERQRKAI